MSGGNRFSDLYFRYRLAGLVAHKNRRVTTEAALAAKQTFEQCAQSDSAHGRRYAFTNAADGASEGSKQTNAHDCILNASILVCARAVAYAATIHAVPCAGLKLE